MLKEKDIKNIVSVGVLVFGILLIIASFIVPPLGIVDNSVLAALGEVFTYTGAICGIEQLGKNAYLKYKNKQDEAEN